MNTLDELCGDGDAIEYGHNADHGEAFVNSRWDGRPIFGVSYFEGRNNLSDKLWLRMCYSFAIRQTV